MRLVDLEQNSSAWLQWRHTGIGSSDAPAVLEMSPWASRKDLWEEKVYRYHKAKSPLSGDQLALIARKMAERESKNETSKNRGKKLEPVARGLYEKFMGYEIPDVCGVHAKFEFMKVSLDGWNPERNRFVEIKCPNQKAHGDAVDGRVPDYYTPQILHQFLVSGADSCDYVSYHDKMPPGHRFAAVRVDALTAQHTLQIDMPLADMIARLEQAEIEFWDTVVRGEFKDL